MNVHRGRSNYLSGLAAEQCVVDHYIKQGYSVLDQRWRAQGGEIDIVLRGSQLVFCEVKKSSHHAKAALHLSSRQAARLQATALAYLAHHDLSLDTNMRFDLALVDATGSIQVIENALIA